MKKTTLLDSLNTEAKEFNLAGFVTKQDRYYLYKKGTKVTVLGESPGYCRQTLFHICKEENPGFLERSREDALGVQYGIPKSIRDSGPEYVEQQRKAIDNEWQAWAERSLTE